MYALGLDMTFEVRKINSRDREVVGSRAWKGVICYKKKKTKQNRLETNHYSAESALQRQSNLKMKTLIIVKLKATSIALSLCTGEVLFSRKRTALLTATLFETLF